MTTTYERNKQTARTAAGVRVKDGHWASKTVHAFREWTGESDLTTWCGLDVDLSDGGRHTTDIITCLQCGEASWGVLWRDGRWF
jgi:hypothetical protein